METLKTHLVKLQNCHGIGERMGVMLMIVVDLHSVYQFAYPLFLAVPDLMTKVNSFNDLNKTRHFMY